MKRFTKGIICALLVCLLPWHTAAEASVPYTTETLSANGDLTKTQTAYKPLGQLTLGNQEMTPEDLFIDQKDQIYLADSKSQKIIVSNLNGEIVKEMGEGILKNPTGVFVDENGEVYAADYEQEKVFRFSSEGKLLKEYEKPDSPLFGSKSPFKPQKIGVDKRGNLYIIGEGSTNGIIQLSREGNFLGYYGVNSTRSSIKSFLQNALNASGKMKLFMKTPPAPDNIAIDEQGLIYSITEGTKEEVIKKLNVAGKNMLAPDISDVASLQDIAVDPLGNIFVSSANGKIYEYDSFGNLLFIFGGKDDGTNRIGLLKQPSGIAVDRNGRLYVADKERGMIQTYDTTSFSVSVHEGIALFKEGLYVESQQYFESVLRQNSSFGLARTAMGRAYYKQQDYEAALEEFKFAEDIGGYSNSFWEIRHEWMQKNLGTVLFFIILAGIFYSVFNHFDKKRNLLKGPKERMGRLKKRKRIAELFFLFKFFRHPIDSFYYLKRKNHASVFSATILYVLLFIEYLFATYQTGFIFSQRGGEEANLSMELLKVFVPLALFIIINYLVSTINDGEGRFADIYRGTIYSLAPYLVFSIPITLITNILTLNESFIYEFSIQIIYAWCVIILFIMIKEIHNYTFSETVRNIFMTLFGMVIMLLVIFIIFVLFDQVYDFIYSIIQEVILRV
ncbi:SMP-30/gluconolactonase/LRE family protein [Metabacillus idriensis]|uniref:SMP-30/gluconolactonase/LRE family protein n=1 Tax=Metabacillus idriensis TaxID=324768 RepID=UPI003D26DC9F